MLDAVLAHGGRFTWDEALMVLVPIAAFAALLAVANRRAKAIQAERQAQARPAGHDSTPDPPT
jgi:hypothetical protein